MVYRYAINLDDIVDEHELFEFKKNISIERIRKSEKYFFSKDRIRCLISEILLGYILEKQFQCKEYQFQYSKYGKPYLKDNDEIFFNISHSGSWVVIGVGTSELGIDVEVIQENYLDIANRYFAREEYQKLLCAEEDERRKLFTIMWTLKESYVKCIGLGMQISFEKIVFRINKKILFYNEGILDNTYVFKVDKLDREHYVAICTNAKENDFGDIVKLHISDIKKN